jgi:transcriptional regulator with XRE-family HTH domain
MQAKSIETDFALYSEGMKSGRPLKSRKSDFAERLRSLREAAGLSQSEMARRLNIRQPSYALWETYNVALKPEQLLALANALGVAVEQLFADSDKSARRGGPKGRARDVFEAVSRLPRRQQEKIFDILQPFVKEHNNEPATAHG